MNIVSEFLEKVTTVVESAAATNAAKVAQAISPTFFAAIALYVIYLIYEIMYAHRDVIMSEVTKNIGAFALVGAFTYSAPYYSQFVIPFVMHAGTDLSAAITGGSGTSTSVDNLWNALSTTLNDFKNNELDGLEWYSFTDQLYVYLIWGVGYVGGLLLIYYTTVFLTLSTFMVGILLSAGILFICFSLFSSTRNMFTAWIGSCLNYILLNLFYSISFSFVISFVEQTVPLDGNINLTSVIYFFMVTIISIFLIEQVGTLCSTLTGGVGINGLTSAANGFASKLASGAMRASGLRSFTRGFASKTPNPFFNAGRASASYLRQSVNLGSKVKAG
ncbi:type IV secretion system protein [Escherichia coli]|uniref:type IV secretion system protein n=1 Tax=Escherichia coli TaxID=562 RepID=UPI0021D3412D|nr:type IV secretion system protein [Escherichia coli]MCQ5512813.1 type IV secretion system protein [Escherichia coli]MCQ5518032.1 type IV secretion system protein [Escherichia coli]MCQ5553220.1 type IV secretion system protein [Escherichia coli]MCQ5564483.1 type IV secretion system protein [Escherichia coli]MCQ5584700.1 type IV secretion system protein [Escherichia coli]